MDSEQEEHDDFREGWGTEEADSEAADDEEELGADELDDEDFLLQGDEPGDDSENGEEDEDEATIQGTNLEPSDQEEPEDDPGDLFESTADAEQLLQVAFRGCYGGQGAFDRQLRDSFYAGGQAQTFAQGMSERQGAQRAGSMQPYQLMGIQRKRARQQEQPDPVPSKASLLMSNLAPAQASLPELCNFLDFAPGDLLVHTAVSISSVRKPVVIDCGPGVGAHAGSEAKQKGHSCCFWC